MTPWLHHKPSSRRPWPSIRAWTLHLCYATWWMLSSSQRAPHPSPKWSECWDLLEKWWIYIYIKYTNPKWFHMISPYSTNETKMVVKPMNNWGVHHWNRANCGSGVLENKNFAMLMFWLLASIVLKKNNVSGDTMKSLLKMWLEQSSFAMLRVPGSVYMDLI